MLEAVSTLGRIVWLVLVSFLTAAVFALLALLDMLIVASKTWLAERRKWQASTGWQQSKPAKFKLKGGKHGSKTQG